MDETVPSGRSLKQWVEPEPGTKVPAATFWKTDSSEYLRWGRVAVLGGGWQGTPGLKTLFRFDLLVVHECYLWQFYFPHVFHQNNLIFKKKSLK